MLERSILRDVIIILQWSLLQGQISGVHEKEYDMKNKLANRNTFPEQFIKKQGKSVKRSLM